MSPQHAGQLPGTASRDSVAWQLSRDPTAPGQARRRLADELGDLPDDLLHVAQLLTSELVTNALAHGRGRIGLSVRRDEGAVTVRVTDNSPDLPMVRGHDLTALSGRGLQIVELLAAGWGTEPADGGAHGKVVWFTLRGTAQPA